LKNIFRWKTAETYWLKSWFSPQIKRNYGPAGLKYLMDKQQGQAYGGPVRVPEVPLTNEERQAIDNEYRQASAQ